MRRAVTLAAVLAAGGIGLLGPALDRAHRAPVVVPLSALPDLSHVAPTYVGSALAPGWHKGAFMEVFVRAYQDSDGDGIGDLRGLISRLDYLQDLGIKGIWLMPVTPSEDHDHGYGVSDLRTIEPAYGTLADFDELIKQAHARGIGVIVDYVMNHSGANSALFAQSRDKRSALRSWYVWEDNAPLFWSLSWSLFGHDPWRRTDNGAYFAQFDGHMPEFNLRDPGALAYHKDNLRFWLNRGVDGFRFDAVPHLVENGPIAWMNQDESFAIMRMVRSVVAGYENRYMVCEASTAVQTWARICGSAFDLDRIGMLVKAAHGDHAAIEAVADYFRHAPSEMSTLVSNHDHFAGGRLWDQVAGDLKQYRLVAATYLLQPGTPFIYYGEELGMAAAPLRDSDARLRAPMSWCADGCFTRATPFRAGSANVARQNLVSEVGRPESLHTFYKAMLHLRNSLPSISQGRYLNASVQRNTLSFLRQHGKERTLVLINYGSEPELVVPQNLPSHAALSMLYPLAATADGTVSSASQLVIPPESVAVYAVRAIQ